MFAEFEKTAHDYCAQGKPLTAEALSQMYLELNQKYFGPDMEKDEEIAEAIQNRDQSYRRAED